MRYWLVMPAAGSGTRFGTATPKQYAALAGRTVIEWALAPFLADGRCAGIVVALASGDTEWPRIAARLQRADHVAAVCGGEHRSLSVRRALASLADRAAAADWVLVHDAVRPCLDASDLERLLEQLAAQARGGLLAVPAADRRRTRISGPGRSAPAPSARSAS